MIPLIIRKDKSPVRNYIRQDVIEALQIMCETFNWEFQDGGQTETIFFRGEN